MALIKVVGVELRSATAITAQLSGVVSLSISHLHPFVQFCAPFWGGLPLESREVYGDELRDGP